MQPTSLYGFAPCESAPEQGYLSGSLSSRERLVASDAPTDVVCYFLGESR